MKSKIHYLQLLFVMLLFVVSACGDNEDDITPPKPETPVITIPDSENLRPVLNQRGGTVSISFTTTADWTASLVNTRAESWITVTPNSGTKGKNEITITATTNETYDERNATVVLKCGSVSKNIVVTQKQKDALTVTSSKYEVDSKGGNISVEVKANISFEVEVKTDWIKQQTEKTRAQTTSNLNFTIDPNETGDKREGEIIIKSGELSETIKVYQGFGDFITLTQKDFTIPEEGGNVDIEIKSTLDYEIKMLSDVDWITEIQSRAVSTHTHHYAVSPNETYDSREVKIVFYDPKDENVADTVSICQMYKGAILVARNEYKIEQDGGKLDFTIQSNIEFNVTTSVTWIQICNNNDRGLIAYSLGLIIHPNESKEAREGIVTIKERNGDRFQTIQVFQQGEVDYGDIERSALIAFYEETGGENWVNNANWCSNAPLNEWYGIYINDDGTLSISLENNNLTGKLSGSLSKVDRLTNIYLSQNNLSGELYDFFAHFSNLSGVSLRNNRFTGTIPDVICQNKNLTDIDLSYNNLGGQIPDKIGLLTALNSLYLHNNQLFGTIPVSLGFLINLWNLDLSNNCLVGCIPLELGNMKECSSLNLSYNLLSGDIPSELGNLSRLQGVDLSNNNLTGTIPIELVKLVPNFITFKIANNRMSGKLPNELTTSVKWSELNIDKDILPQQEGYGFDYDNSDRYTSTDYSLHKKLFQIQEHTKGKGIKVVIMGDGYSDRQIANGIYDSKVNEIVDAFFLKEPFRTFRSYFDVYKIYLVSPYEYLEGTSALQIEVADYGKNGTFVGDKCQSLIKKLILEYDKIALSSNDLEDITVVTFFDTPEFHSSVAYLSEWNEKKWASGFAVAYCMDNFFADMEGIVVHEACGHAFGKLADEYYYGDWIWKDDGRLRKQHEYGWMVNADETSDLNQVHWKNFISPLYENEKIGVYEGANRYQNLYRPTELSIMSNSSSKYNFNAPSRCSIYRRIMELAGEEYSFEKFLEYDKVNRVDIGRKKNTLSLSMDAFQFGAPPVIIHTDN